MRPMLLAMLWCLPSLAVAQVGVTTSTAYQITGLGTITKVGDVLLSSVSPTITSKPVGVVNVNATDVEISVSDINRLPYQPLKLDADSWMIDKPGKWWVEVKEYGTIALADGSTRRIVLDSTVVVVEFSFSPTPIPPIPDPPGPTPDPPIPPSPIANDYGVGKVAFDNAPRDPVLAVRYQSIYKQSGDFLFGIPSLKFITSSSDVHNNDPNRSVMAWIKQQYSLTVCTDVETCKQWEVWKRKVAEAFTESQKKRAFTRNDWYSALNEVANALGQVK